MNKLQELISEREKLKDRERVLASEIKRERKVNSAQKKDELKRYGTGVSQEEHSKLRNKCHRLEGMIALLEKTNGKNYKEIAKILGIKSVSTVGDVCRREIDLLRDASINFEMQNNPNFDYDDCFTHNVLNQGFAIYEVRIPITEN